MKRTNEYKLFCMIDAGDNIGSGFLTILNTWREENWRKPDTEIMTIQRIISETKGELLENNKD